MSDSQDFNIYLGTTTGLLKGVSINPRTPIAKTFHNLQLGLPPKEEEITCMNWDGEGEKEIIVGLKNRVVKVFDLEQKKYTSKYVVTDQSEGEENYGSLRGVARLDGALITATESGLVKLWRHKQEEIISFNTIDTEVNASGKLKRSDFDSEENRLKHLATLKAGRQLCKMEVSPVNNSVIACGGKENDLQVWDLNRPEGGPIFRAKNVKPNFLQLRVPVWVSDICFPDATSSFSVACVSRHGHVRLYDTRTNEGKELQRRPVMEMTFPDEALTAMSGTNCQHQVLVGTATGQMALFDFRSAKKNNGMFRKFKGSVGGVRSICCDRKSGYFASAGLDKFVRVYNVNSKSSVNKIYLKSRLNCLLLSPNFDPLLDETERKSLKEEEVEAPKVENEDDDELWDKMDKVGENKRALDDGNNVVDILSKPVINRIKKKKMK